LDFVGAASSRDRFNFPLSESFSNLPLKRIQVVGSCPVCPLVTQAVQQINGPGAQVGTGKSPERCFDLVFGVCVHGCILCA
jgi:hypothetical protein